MTEASSPSLPAIRERAERAIKHGCNNGTKDTCRCFSQDVEAIAAHFDAWDEFKAHACDDILALLSLVARLQGERDSLRAALRGVATRRFPTGPCWCQGDVVEDHTDACRAARAALGEETG